MNIRIILIVSSAVLILGLVGKDYAEYKCPAEADEKGYKRFCGLQEAFVVMAAISGLILGTAIFGWFAVTGNARNYTKSVVQKVTQTSNLMALKSTSEQESSLDGFGWVTLGSGNGYVNGSSKKVSYYKFYTKDSNDEVNQVKVKPDDVIVKITTAKPHYDTVEVTTTMILKQKYQALGIRSVPAPMPVTEEKHILYIPKNSIRQEYSLN